MVADYDFGRHFIVGLAGTELSEEERLLFRELRPAGVIVFTHNIVKNSDTWMDTLVLLLQCAREASGRETFLTTIDHEGGRVHRLITPVTHFPEARDWPAEAYNVGYAMGSELRALGFNVNFAPVLDIHSEEHNTVIGRRAFGTDAERVATAGAAFYSGQEDAGVAACGKHFPGHGSTVADSHFELPVLELPVEVLETRELLPFKALIEQGIQLLMTAHVLYPRLDAERPGTLSRIIVNDLLRQELSYKNAVISDAVEMGALGSFSDEQMMRWLLEATVDFVLVAKPDLQPPVLRAVQLKEAMQRAATELACLASLQSSEERIERFLAHVRKLDASAPRAARALVGCEGHQALCNTLRRTV